MLANLVFLSKNTALNKLPIQQFVLSQSIKVGNFDLAKETLNQIETDGTENLKRLVLLKQFEIDMLQTSKTIQNLTKQDLVILNDLAGDEDPAGIMARNTILGLNEETIQFFTPATEEQEIENVKKVRNPLLTIDDDDNFVYPNPANNILSIDVTGFAKQTEKLTVKIYSSSGYLNSKIVTNNQTSINYTINDIPTGTYIIEVIDEINNQRKKSKLLIVR